MTRFADLADGGVRLAPLVEQAVASLPNPCLLAILPDGVPVAESLADILGLPILAVALDREGEPSVRDLPDVRDRVVIVVDAGVETGTAARLVGAAAREADVGQVLLAVPVCPREAQAGLERIYDVVVAVDRPMVRRDLRWHFTHFDTIDEAEALQRLDAR